MRGTRARALRVAVYGTDYAPRGRKYQLVEIGRPRYVSRRQAKSLSSFALRKLRKAGPKYRATMIRADARREAYQRLKGRRRW